MGYYTYLSMEIDREEPTVEQVAEAMADLSNDIDAAFWRTALKGETDVKWYGSVTEYMKQVSRRYPDAVLTLRGEGEDSEDQWVEYYQNGRVQVEQMPEWTPPLFDPAKLE